MDISLSEWLTLMEALDKGLAHSGITEFYYLSRMILCKSENEFDKYDMLFNEYSTVRYPEIGMAVTGAVIAAIGIGTGMLVDHLQVKANAKKKLNT